MTFLTFLMYFVFSSLIYSSLTYLLLEAFQKYAKYKFNKMVKKGQIQIMSLEELLEKTQGVDDKKWN